MCVVNMVTGGSSLLFWVKAMISDCTTIRKQKSEEKYPQLTAFILYKRFI